MNYNKLAEEAHENAVKHGFWETKSFRIIISNVYSRVRMRFMAARVNWASYHDIVALRLNVF